MNLLLENNEALINKNIVYSFIKKEKILYYKLNLNIKN